ncbi:MAG: COQ9 family protein [Caulobacteraceae bacterium]|nr:COQ9 family protein [Caulobacteraceae bacterium]
MTTEVSLAPVDWTEAAEQRLLDAAITLAPSLGWGSVLVSRAARQAGFSEGEAMLIVPNGSRDLAALLSRRHDAAGLAALSGVDPKGLKIRQRIAQAVEARLEAAAADGEAVRRWAGFLALPFNLPLAARLVWESADGVWRWAGDVSVDENHYSKRAILAAILASTLAIRLTSGREAASAYLAARIENVMAFETWKARLKPAEFGREIAAALGRLRYGKA